MVVRLAVLYLITVAAASCFKEDPPSNIPPPSTPVEIATKVLVNGLDHPWEILWGPDNMIWMTERSGRISRVNPTSGAVTALATIDEVHSVAEGGLLGMAVYPPFSEPSHIYVAYNYDKSGTYTFKVVRYSYNSGSLADPLVIIDDLDAASIHNGSRLVISSDQKLFVTTGDASDQSHPQNVSSRNGKVLRFNLDGSVPADNPDPSSPVWSIGHRNAQGLVFVNDSLFSSEHGPDTDDEINIIHKGGNYGWPDVRGVCGADEEAFCAANNVVEPVMQWTPTIATCGLDYYNNDLLPQWKNSLLLCTLKGSTLYQLKLNAAHSAVDSSAKFFENQFGRLRDVCIAPDGRVFLSTDNGNDDKIIEVSKKQ